MWPWRRRIVCHQAVDLVTDYLEGALSPSQRARFEAHLRGCPHCTEYLEQFRATIRAAGRVQPSELAPGEKAELIDLYRRWRAEEP
jgi:anti-sigma factor RsiW